MILRGSQTGKLGEQYFSLLCTSLGTTMTITRRLLLLSFFLSFTVSVHAQEWRPPTTLKKLPNGLTVVISEDHSAPTVGLCISYGIGSRLQPVVPTGFPHLFAHMVFQGKP